MASTPVSLPFDGKKARRERELQGLTLADLAERCENAGLRINITTLYRWETGAFRPSAPRLKILTRALNIRVEQLLTEEQPGVCPMTPDEINGNGGQVRTPYRPSERATA
jgi:transcriptional regulator with XRE-family HTH domain